MTINLTMILIGAPVAAGRKPAFGGLKPDPDYWPRRGCRVIEPRRRPSRLYVHDGAAWARIDNGPVHRISLRAARRIQKANMEEADFSTRSGQAHGRSGRAAGRPQDAAETGRAARGSRGRWPIQSPALDTPALAPSGPAAGQGKVARPPTACRRRSPRPGWPCRPGRTRWPGAAANCLSRCWDRPGCRPGRRRDRARWFGHRRAG